MEYELMQAIALTLDGIADADERQRVREYIADLRRQLAEAQAAASPALVEEYARACHYAGASGLASLDWPQWLRWRSTRG